MDTLEKGLVSGALISISAGSLYAHTTASVYPGLPIAGLVSLLLLAAAIFFCQNNVSTFLLASIVGIGVIYRVIAYTLPASMVGYDASSYAVRSLTIIENSSIDGLIGAFYSSAPLFSIFGAESALVNGVSVDTAYIIIPILSAIIFPVVAATIADYITDNRQAVALATLLTALFPATIKFSLRAAPIIFAGLLFSILSLITIEYTSDKSPRYLVLLFVILVALMFTHKLGVVIAVLVFLTLLASSYYFASPFDRTSRRHIYVLTFLAIAVLCIQWVYLTTFLVDAYVRIAAIFGTYEWAQPSVRTAVVPYDPSPVETVVSVGYMFSMLSVGGLLWLYLLLRRHHPPTARLMGFVAIIVGLSMLEFVSNAAGGFDRTIHFGASTLCALIAVGYHTLTVDRSRIVTSLCAIVLILVLVSQPMSEAAAPDYRDGPRHYLNQGEVDAKAFATDHAGGAHMDSYYGHEVLDFERAVATGDPKYQQQVPSRQRDELLTKELTNRSLFDHKYDSILLRNHDRPYRMDGGRWLLTWDPIDTATYRSDYHRVYDNGESVLFVRSE